MLKIYKNATFMRLFDKNQTHKSDILVTNCLKRDTIYFIGRITKVKS